MVSTLKFPAAIAALLTAQAACASADLRLNRQHVPGFLDPVFAGAVAADFEGAGRDDLAVTGFQRAASVNGITPDEPRSGFVAILRYDAALQNYAIAQTLITDDGMLAGLAADPSAAPGAGLVVVSQDGMLTRYAGWPLHLVSRVALGRAVTAMRVGDVDGDAKPEVVVTDPVAGVAAYDLLDGSLVRQYPGRTAESLELAQLDADAALEIVLSGVPGYVVDGATNATDWQYAGGFGSILASGRILPGGGVGFLAGSDYISAYQGSAYPGGVYSPVWSVELWTSALDVAELNGSAAASVLMSGYYGPVSIIDPLTQAVQYTIVDQASGHIVAGHFEGGASTQIAFGSGLNSTGVDTLEVYALDGTSRFGLSDENGPFVVTRQGDVDGDGMADGVWASYYSDSMYDGGFIHVYDPANGSERWRARISASNDAISALALTPAAGRANIAVAGVYFYTPELFLVDGTTHLVVASNQQLGFATQPIHQLRALDSDLLAAASDTTIELGRFSGSDLHPVWHRTLGTTYGSTLNDVQLADLGGSLNGVALLATSTSLVAYDLNALAVAWSLPRPTASASVLAQGDGTPVIGALGTDGHLRLLSLDGSSLLADIAVGAQEARAVAAVPNLPGSALLCIDRRIDLVDLDQHVVTQASPWLGGIACDRGNLAVDPVPQSNVSHVSAGSIVGAFDLRVAGDELFADGFEGP